MIRRNIWTLTENVTGFNIGEFENLTSFAARKRYADEKLKKVGAGSSRIAYETPDGKVLKLAKNKKGVAQNGVECDFMNDQYAKEYITEIYDCDPNNLWVLAEKAKKLTPNRFKEITGVSIDDLGTYLRNIYSLNNPKLRIGTRNQPNKDELDENEFVQGMFNMMANYDLSAGDMGRISSYGEVMRDGQPDVVLIDYGLNDDTFSQYYSKNESINLDEYFVTQQDLEDYSVDVDDVNDGGYGGFALQPDSVSRGGLNNEEVSMKKMELPIGKIFTGINENLFDYKNLSKTSLLNTIKQIMGFDKNKTDDYRNTKEVNNLFKNYLISIQNLDRILEISQDEIKLYNKILDIQDLLKKFKVINESYTNHINENTNLFNKNFAQNIANYAAKSLKLGKPKLIGSGFFGYAFDVGDSVIKITSDKSEAVESLKVKSQQPFENIAEIYGVYETDKKPFENANNNAYVIHLEKLNTNGIINIYDSIEKIIGYDIPTIIDYYVYDILYYNKDVKNDVEKKLSNHPKEKKYYNQLLNIASALNSINVESTDFSNPDNLGFKKNGDLAYFDIGFGDTFNEPKGVEKINIGEDGTTLYTTKHGSRDEDFKEDELNERIKTVMPNSKEVSIKKSCQIGGKADGTSDACDQGDISNIEINDIDDDNKHRKKANKANIAESSKAKNDGKVKFGCLMAYFDIPDWNKILDRINDNDLYDDGSGTFGKENEPHITVLYGFHDDVTYKDFIEILEKHGTEFTFKTNKISLFENELFDVVKFDIEPTQQILDLRNDVMELPHTLTYKDYHPHMTVAYVKKGMGKKYVNDFGKKYLSLETDKLVFSDVDRNKKEFLSERIQNIQEGIITRDELLQFKKKGNDINEYIENQGFLAFHGSPTKISKFTTNYVGHESAVDQEGVGIYFTTSFEDAHHYTDKGGYVHTVKLSPRKLLDESISDNVNIDTLVWLIKQSEDWEDKAMNWSKDPESGAYVAAEAAKEYNEKEKDVFLQIWVDFFRYEPKRYLENMVKLGIDGIVVDRTNDGEKVKHIIIYNPDVIEIRDVEQVEVNENNQQLNELMKDSFDLPPFQIKDYELLLNGKNVGQVFISQKNIDDGIHYDLSEIKIHPEFRGQYIFTRFMNALIKHANQNNIIISLTPEQMGSGGLSTTKLKQVYSALGFEKNSGSNRNFQVNNSYIKYPENLNEENVSGYTDDDIKRLKNRYDIGFIKDKFGDQYLVIDYNNGLYTVHHNRVNIGHLYVSKVGDKYIPNAGNADAVYIKDEYRNKGIAKALYKYVIDKGINLQPSDVQSSGAKGIWKSLKNNKVIQEANIMNLKELPFKEAIQQMGGKIYSVGGAVRDEFLGKESKDLDILITGIPMDKLQQVLSQFGKVDAVGKSFGILKFKPEGSTEDIDVAIPRTEVATGQGGHKGFDVNTDHNLSIEDDLKRRDFSFNAIAKDIDGNLIDPFGGQKDLANGIIKLVNPEAFSDDPLRMIRAIQFAARFSGDRVFTIEPQTEEMIKKNASRIKEIAGERILEELRKVIDKGGDPLYAADLLRETGLYENIFGSKSPVGKEDWWDHDAWNDIRTLGEFIFMLLHPITDTPAQMYKERLKGDDATAKEIMAYNRAFNEVSENPVINRSVVFNMNKFSPKSLDSKIVPQPIKVAISELRSNTYPISIKELQIDGNDLSSIGLKGKEIGDAIKKTLILVYSDKVKNKKENLLNLFKKK